MAGSTTIGRWSGQATFDVSGFSTGIKTMETDAKRAESTVIRSMTVIQTRVSSGFSGLASSLQSGGIFNLGSAIGGFLGGFGGSAINTIVDGLTNIVARGIEAAESQRKLQEQFNLTGSQAAGFLQLGRRLGFEFDDLNRGLQGAARHLGDVLSAQRAGESGGSAGLALRRLRLEAEHLAGIPLPQALAEIGDRLRAITNPAERFATAQALLGREFRDFMPILMRGTAGLDAATAAANVFTQEQLEMVQVLREAWRDLGLSWENMWNRIGVSLAASPAGRAITEQQRLLRELRRIADDARIRQQKELLANPPAPVEPMGGAFKEGGALTSAAQLEMIAQATSIESLRDLMADLAKSQTRTIEKQGQANHAYDKYIADLRLEAATLGMTAAEASRYRLALMGVSQAKLDQAAATQSMITAWNEERRIAQRDLALHNQMVNSSRSAFERFEIELERINRAGLNPEQEASAFANAFRGLSSGIPERRLPAGLEMGSREAISLINQNAIQSQSVEEQILSIERTHLEVDRNHAEYSRQLLEAWRRLHPAEEEDMLEQ